MRRYYHGLDPWRLSLHQWEQMFKAMSKIAELESGKLDHASRAHEMAGKRKEHEALTALRERVMSDVSSRR